MKNNIQNQHYWIYLTAVFLILFLPLLSAAPLFHPPAWAKAVVFRIIFSILIFVFIAQILYKKHDFEVIKKAKSLLNRKNPIFLPFWLLISYLSVQFLATVFSLEPYFSVWGSPLRGGGFLNLAFIILFAVFIFLTIREKDWKKVWAVILAVGTLVSLIGIVQKFAPSGNFFISYQWRPIGTMGGPMFFALFLLLLTFLPLSLSIINKGKKKYFYLLLSGLFVFAIILSATRSAFIGVGLGALFFIFFYPDLNKSKTIKRLKILLGLFLFLGLVLVFTLNNNPKVVKELSQERTVFGPALSRTLSLVQNFSIEKILKSRGSGWQVGFKGLMDRPVLGYGPENFSIAFDKYYDPNLPGIAKEPGGSGSTGWWDRGHNFLLDISTTAGIPALIIYLLLFTALFWQLQKIKSRNKYLAENRDKPIMAHGIQATFIAYLTANLFSFDIFSTYLISFTFIAYSFFIISKSSLSKEEPIKNKRYCPPRFWKSIALTVLFAALIWFIFIINLKPLFVNSKINIAVLLSSNRAYQQALTAIDSAYEKGKNTILKSYLRLRYIDIVGSLYSAIKTDKEKKELAYIASNLAKYVTEIRPYYTRAWMIDGIYTYRVVKYDENLEQEKREKLIERAYASFKKSYQLSPKHQKIFIGWIKLDMLLGNYKDAKEKVEECIAVNDEFRDCWWAKALVYGNLGDLDTAAEAILISKDKGFDIEERALVSQLINLYGKIVKISKEERHYQTLEMLYQRIIKAEPDNFQHHASLAYIYLELGKYEQARQEAMIVLEMSPESRANVNEFIKTLPYPYNSSL